MLPGPPADMGMTKGCGKPCEYSIEARDTLRVPFDDGGSLLNVNVFPDTQNLRSL